MLSTIWVSALALWLVGTEAGVLGKRFSLGRADGVYPLDVVDKLEEASLSKFQAYLASSKAAGNCTLETAVRRKEWSDLPPAQRQEYSKAVLCLMSKPGKASKTKYPGALSRYDDFVATHMTLAGQLHSTPHLLPAHRLFLWYYEQSLRNECGYTGYQPYWNWDRYAADPINSPLFNGNESSMGGNGLKAQYPGIKQSGFKKPYDLIPAAEGGGCVTTGPFKNMTVSLGPIGTVLTDVPKNPQSDGFGSNPRCLRRDVNKFSAAATTANLTYNLIMESPTVEKFQQAMLGTPEKNDWGVHIGGHYTIGGDPGGDFFSSPGDPVFWFHHGMIDRIWWIWQMQDPKSRIGVLPGNPAQTDVVDLGWLHPAVKTWDLVSNIGAMGGQICYIYD